MALGRIQIEAQLRRQKGPVTDILVWVQCFATFISTLAAAQPSKINKLMGYMTTNVRCHHNYEGPSWVLYDWTFRHRTEATELVGYQYVTI